MIQPIFKESYLDVIPPLLQKVGAWSEQYGEQSMIVEIPYY